MDKAFLFLLPEFFFSGNPGETVSQTVTFGNTSKTTLSFITRIQDWDRDSVGTKIYYDSNTKPLSNAKWITLSSNAVSVQPGENKQVIVSLTIPPDAKQLTHSMLFFYTGKRTGSTAEKCSQNWS
ncbi:hypothetical protein TH53_02575 [Pedobacter lusitanus]|uniref:C5a peptidase/Subtilisin-like protease SBT2-like Fn3-like domain-containing protein n=1 Tax=Pedobacter lusitanus TaxID=1503925 RepID=A0A0D0GVZ0_9SPHI|nr:Fn3-like domain-containing protein [Pedobacter lusitanus]KIO78646.1 hypothetical protein TH53_02575 [Pedobacter lusitanus]